MAHGAYKPIEAYGLIGNLETCALVGQDGAIDWCCLPYLQSPSVCSNGPGGTGATGCTTVRSRTTRSAASTTMQ